MKIKTSELTGAALDWAVADALGYEPMVVHQGMPRAIVSCVERSNNEAIFHDDYSPSISWVYGGPLVDKFQIYVSPPHIVFATKIIGSKRVSADKVYNCWTATISARVAKKPSPIEGLPGLGGNYTGQGDTPLVAICRAVVACKLGEEVEVPEELGGAA